MSTLARPNIGVSANGRASARRGTREFVLWGSDIVSLHDAAWASHGVEVVRPGREPAASRGEASLHLLLDEEQLVWFDLGPVVKRMHWVSPDMLRVRVSQEVGDAYREEIRVDAAGAFDRIERRYSLASGGSARAWVTPRGSIASRWRSCESGAEARNMIRSLSAEVRTAPIGVRGGVGRRGDAEGEGRWLRPALAEWSRLGAVFPGVYEYEPGVWAHERTRIAPGAKLVGPLWLGAGLEIGDDEVIVGPGVVCDGVSGVGGAREIDWPEMMSRHWNLPAFGRGTRARGLTKRGFDVLFSLAVLLATAPVYPLAMLAIYLEDGRPFFFAHRRQTRGGREFPCLKFRTMRRDAEKIKAELLRENQADGPQFFIENDPRVLRVGRVLRRYQIDELPQFVNVLLGHMSVVGPRPSPDSENQYCPAWREARLSVRPGVTGLWQVRRTREPETDFQEWIKYDLEYVQHYSFWRDMEIIGATVIRVLRGG